MHALCVRVNGAGVLPSQYIHLSQFAGLGTVGHAYIRAGIQVASFPGLPPEGLGTRLVYKCMYTLKKVHVHCKYTTDEFTVFLIFIVQCTISVATWTS